MTIRATTTMAMIDAGGHRSPPFQLGLLREGFPADARIRQTAPTFDLQSHSTHSDGALPARRRGRARGRGGRASCSR